MARDDQWIQIESFSFGMSEENLVVASEAERGDGGHAEWIDVISISMPQPQFDEEPLDPVYGSGSPVQGDPPAAMCWYWWDASQTQGMWDHC